MTNLAPQPTNIEQSKHLSIHIRKSHHFRKDQVLSRRYRKEEQGSPDLGSALIVSNTRSCKKQRPQIRNDNLLPQFIPAKAVHKETNLQCCIEETSSKPRWLTARQKAKQSEETVGLIWWLGTTKHSFVFLVKWVVMNKGTWFSINQQGLCALLNYWLTPLDSFSSHVIYYSKCRALSGKG